MWQGLWERTCNASHLAALIFCELVEEAPLHTPQNPWEAAAAGRAFIESVPQGRWGRRP